MPGSKTQPTANQTLDFWFGGQASPGPPPVWYVGLFTQSPTSVSLGVEVNATGYQRAMIINNLTSFPSAALGVKTNAVAIDFGFAQEDYGNVVAIGFFDPAGTLKFVGILPLAITVLQGDGIEIPVNSLTVQEA